MRIALSIADCVSRVCLVVWLQVLPETKNKPSPETIVDAVAQMEGLLANANKRAHQVAALLGAALSIGVSYLLATIVAADGVADNVWAGVGAGVALAAVRHHSPSPAPCLIHAVSAAALAVAALAVRARGVSVAVRPLTLFPALLTAVRSFA